ncbi:Hypothetical protein ETEE_2172 [Edwardsiella anguillarum ET080813]|uniref:Uncharacterized protein n=1 Tax=Edwardsiella anguillarum ET080813 TaxID=667120 RepID=A0A076LL60_9GAMM|nr:Hypothetical protein ETEE_2172 [Edwardsiella anguillarum ET080813]
MGGRTRKKASGRKVCRRSRFFIDTAHILVDYAVFFIIQENFKIKNQ